MAPQPSQEGTPVENLHVDKKRAIQSLGALTTFDAFEETCESASDADTSVMGAYPYQGPQGPPSSLEVAGSENMCDLELELWLHLEPDSDGNFPKEADPDWPGEPLLPPPPAERDAGPCGNKGMRLHRQGARRAAPDGPVPWSCLPPLWAAQHEAALEVLQRARAAQHEAALEILQHAGAAQHETALEILQYVKAAGEAVGQAAKTPANTEEPGPLVRDVAASGDPEIEKTGRPALAYEPRESNRPLERWEREIECKATGLDDPLDIILEELQDPDHPPGPSELQGASLAQSQS